MNNKDIQCNVSFIGVLVDKGAISKIMGESIISQLMDYDRLVELEKAFFGSHNVNDQEL